MKKEIPITLKLNLEGDFWEIITGEIRELAVVLR
jgi:hypothetical protein